MRYSKEETGRRAPCQTWVISDKVFSSAPPHQEWALGPIYCQSFSIFKLSPPRAQSCYLQRWPQDHKSFKPLIVDWLSPRPAQLGIADVSKCMRAALASLVLEAVCAFECWPQNLDPPQTLSALCLQHSSAAQMIL